MKYRLIIKVIFHFNGISRRYVLSLDPNEKLLIISLLLILRIKYRTKPELYNDVLYKAYLKIKI